MPWWTPKTWAFSEVATADHFNQQLRDDLNTLKNPIDANAKLVALDAAHLADLNGLNLTGLAVVAAGNTFTAGKSAFADGRVRLPVGADKYAGSAGAKVPGSVWIEGDHFHHVSDEGDEWRYLGNLIGAVGVGLAGYVWIEGPYLHYIDADGDERIVVTTVALHTDASAQAGSVWVETYPHWIQESGTQEYQGHADVSHTDHGDHDEVGNPVHTNHNDHDNFSEPHQDFDDHGDGGFPHSDFLDHQDHIDGVHVDLNPHGDFNDHTDFSNPHQDHDDHDNHQDHDDSGPHTNHNDHDDAPADSRPELIGP
jgi:hypothetical protein